MLDAKDIRLIATDVDGTLLNTQQELTKRTECAVSTAARLGIPVRQVVLRAFALGADA